MRTFHYLVPGVLKTSFKDADSTDGGYQVERLVRKILNNEHVTHFNLCCDSDKTVFPARINGATNAVQYFNGTDWVDLSTIGTSAAFLTVNKPLVKKSTATAVDTTATVTAAQLAGGLFTSTSAAAVNLTLPTATLAATALGATRGTTFDFTVDNGLGANTVTVVVGTGITASSAVTGGTTLTVASGVVGQFRLYFQSGTTAKLSRIA